jgi:hypothetical protein
MESLEAESVIAGKFHRPESYVQARKTATLVAASEISAEVQMEACCWASRLWSLAFLHIRLPEKKTVLKGLEVVYGENEALRTTQRG